MDLRLRHVDLTFHLHAGREDGRSVYHVRRIDADGEGSETTALPLEVRDLGGGEFAVDGPAGPRRGYAARDGDSIWVAFAGAVWRLETDRGSAGRRRGHSAHPAAIASPMPGQVLRVLVAVGDRVERGQALMVVEAMKMQIEIAAPHAGRVSVLQVAPGSQVHPGVPLAEVEEEPPAPGT